MGSAPSKRAEAISNEDLSKCIQELLAKKGRDRAPKCAVSDVVQELEARHADTDFSKRVPLLTELLEKEKQKWFLYLFTPVEEEPLGASLLSSYDADGRIGIGCTRERATDELRRVKHAPRDNTKLVKMLRTEYEACVALRGQARAEGLFDKPVAFFDTEGDLDVFLVLELHGSYGVPVVQAVAALGVHYNEAIIVRIVRALVRVLGLLHQSQRVLGLFLPEGVLSFDDRRLIHKVRIEGLCFAETVAAAGKGLLSRASMRKMNSLRAQQKPPQRRASVKLPPPSPSHGTRCRVGGGCDTVDSPSSPGGASRPFAPRMRQRQSRSAVGSDHADLASLAQELLHEVSGGLETHLGDLLKAWGPMDVTAGAAGGDVTLTEATDIQSLGRFVFFLCTGRCCTADAREGDLFSCGEWDDGLSPSAREFVTRCLFQPTYTSVMDVGESEWLTSRDVDLSLLPLQTTAARLSDYMNGMPHVLFSGDDTETEPSPCQLRRPPADERQASDISLQRVAGEGFAGVARLNSDLVATPCTLSSMAGVASWQPQGGNSPSGAVLRPQLSGGHGSLATPLAGNLSGTGGSATRGFMRHNTGPPGGTPPATASASASLSSSRQKGSRERGTAAANAHAADTPLTPTASGATLHHSPQQQQHLQHPPRLEDFLRTVDMPPAVQELLVRIERERLRGEAGGGGMNSNPHGISNGDIALTFFDDNTLDAGEAQRLARDEAEDRALILSANADHMLALEQILEVIDRSTCVSAERDARCVLVLMANHCINACPSEGGVAVHALYQEALWMEVCAAVHKDGALWGVRINTNVAASDRTWPHAAAMAVEIPTPLVDRVMRCVAKSRRVICEREAARRAALCEDYTTSSRRFLLPRISLRRLVGRETYARGEVGIEEAYFRRQWQRVWADAGSRLEASWLERQRLFTREARARTAAARDAVAVLEVARGYARGAMLLLGGEVHARGEAAAQFRRELGYLRTVDVRGVNNRPRNELDASCDAPPSCSLARVFSPPREREPFCVS